MLTSFGFLLHGVEAKTPSSHGDIAVGLAKAWAPLAVRRVVAGMRLNFGHPSGKDLLRFAAGQGANQTTLLCISATRRAARDRAERASQPRPCQMPRVGQLGDRMMLLTPSFALRLCCAWFAGSTSANLS